MWTTDPTEMERDDCQWIVGDGQKQYGWLLDRPERSPMLLQMCPGHNEQPTIHQLPELFAPMIAPDDSRELIACKVSNRKTGEISGFTVHRVIAPLSKTPSPVSS